MDGLMDGGIHVRGMRASGRKEQGSAVNLSYPVVSAMLSISMQ
jgi:hypothetical protein